MPERVLPEIPTINGEPEHVYRAFQVYVMQAYETPNARRSRAKIAEQFEVSQVSVHRWYHVFQWKQRAAAFDAMVNRQSALGIKVKVSDDDKMRATAILVSSEATIALSVIGELNKRLGRHLSGEEPMDTAEMKSLIGTLKTASDMARRGLDLPMNIRSNAGNRIVDNGEDEDDGVGEVFEIGLTN